MDDINLLKGLVAKKVRLNLYIPAGATAINRDDIICYKGQIKEVVTNGAAGYPSGYLVFQHARWFVEEAKFHTSYLNLNGCVIFGVDVFPDDYDWSDYKNEEEENDELR